MEYQIINMVGISIGFLILFAAAEYLHHYKKVEVEKTRKLVHLGSGLMTMAFPFLFQSVMEVAILSFSFLGILALSKGFKLLPSINAVERKTTGSYWFPLAVIVCFLAQGELGNMTFYYLPLLTLTLADPAACFVGERMPLHVFKFKESQKSIGGSLAFFAVAFSLSFSLIDEGFQNGLTTHILIAGVATIAEFFGGKGYDNISIPASCIATLALLQTQIPIYV